MAAREALAALDLTDVPSPADSPAPPHAGTPAWPGVPGAATVRAIPEEICEDRAVRLFGRRGPSAPTSAGFATAGTEVSGATAGTGVLALSMPTSVPVPLAVVSLVEVWGEVACAAADRFGTAAEEAGGPFAEAPGSGGNGGMGGTGMSWPIQASPYSAKLLAASWNPLLIAGGIWSNCPNSTYDAL